MTTAITTWVLIGISFTAYFILSLMYKKIKIGNLEFALHAHNGLYFLNLKHLLGIVLFGAVFYCTLPELRYLVRTIEIPNLYVLLPFLLVLFLSVYLAYVSVQKVLKNKKQLSGYNFSNAWCYFIIRFAFLMCYEFFFRGVLLYKFLDNNSLFLAIVYSNIAYAVIHVFDSKKEIIGTIPFGIALCLFTYYTESIWYAFILHTALSGVYEISMFYNQTLKTSQL